MLKAYTLVRPAVNPAWVGIFGCPAIVDRLMLPPSKCVKVIVVIDPLVLTAAVKFGRLALSTADTKSAGPVPPRVIVAELLVPPDVTDNWNDDPFVNAVEDTAAPVADTCPVTDLIFNLKPA